MKIGPLPLLQWLIENHYIFLFDFLSQKINKLKGIEILNMVLWRVGAPSKSAESKYADTQPSIDEKFIHHAYQANDSHYKIWLQ